MIFRIWCVSNVMSKIRVMNQMIGVIIGLTRFASTIIKGVVEGVIFFYQYSTRYVFNSTTTSGKSLSSVAEIDIRINLEIWKKTPWCKYVCLGFSMSIRSVHQQAIAISKSYIPRIFDCPAKRFASLAARSLLSLVCLPMADWRFVARLSSNLLIYKMFLNTVQKRSRE